MPGKVSLPCDAAFVPPNSDSQLVPVVKRKATEENAMEINPTTSSLLEPATQKKRIKLTTDAAVESVTDTPKDTPAMKARLSTEAIVESSEDMNKNEDGNQEVDKTAPEIVTDKSIPTIAFKTTQTESKPKRAPKRPRDPNRNPNIREKSGLYRFHICKSYILILFRT